jgi:hypothetical protein
MKWAEGGGRVRNSLTSCDLTFWIKAASSSPEVEIETVLKGSVKGIVTQV